MAKKLLNPMEDPPTASSSDDDENQIHNSPGEEPEEDEDSSSESKDPIKTADSDPETDSDSESDLPVKSIPATAAAAKSGTKRPNEGTSKDTKNLKKSKTGDEEIKTGEESKKPAFQRLWSEQDEITLLQGMIDFKSETGKSPYESSNRFYEIIKESIRFEFSKNQFMDKIRSLKRKYISKEKTGVFSKAHDQKCFELSKIVWGGESVNGGSKKSPKGNEKKVSVSGEEPGWFENSFVVKSIASFGVDEDYVKRKWSLVPVETKKKIEEKLRVLQGKEMEFVLEKVEFVHKVTSMINGVSKN